MPQIVTPERRRQIAMRHVPQFRLSYEERIRSDLNLQIDTLKRRLTKAADAAKPAIEAQIHVLEQDLSNLGSGDQMGIFTPSETETL